MNYIPQSKYDDGPHEEYEAWKEENDVDIHINCELKGTSDRRVKALRCQIKDLLMDVGMHSCGKTSIDDCMACAEDTNKLNHLIMKRLKEI